MATANGRICPVTADRSMRVKMSRRVQANTTRTWRRKAHFMGGRGVRLRWNEESDPLARVEVRSDEMTVYRTK